jgi:hypothetical protein
MMNEIIATLPQTVSTAHYIPSDECEAGSDRLITPESITGYDPVPSVIRDPRVWLYRCIILSANNYDRLSDLEACRFFCTVYDLRILSFLENFLTV